MKHYGKNLLLSPETSPYLLMLVLVLAMAFLVLSCA